MQKLIIDCSKPIGEQETLVDMTEEEIAAIKYLDATSLSTETVTIGAAGTGGSGNGQAGIIFVEEFY